MFPWGFELFLLKLLNTQLQISTRRSNYLKGGLGLTSDLAGGLENLALYLCSWLQGRKRSRSNFISFYLFSYI